MAKTYIKDNKIYSLPIVIKTGNGTQITTSEELIFAAGYEEYIPPVVKKSLEQLIKESDEMINKETDYIILNDFKWRDEEFYLTIENQTNFANMYIAKEYLTYPQKIKTKTGFIDLNSVEEVTEFYLAGVNFVKQCLEECWTRKLEAAALITEEYNTSVE